MSLIAINILLDPDAATVDKARTINARLRGNYPDGFAFDADHAPHITLLQRFVRTADLAQVAKAAAGMLRTQSPMKWDSKAISQPTVDYVNHFVGPRTGINCNPHMTVGIGQRDFVDALKAEPFEAFPVRAVSVSLYQLGDFGVAQRRLDELHRC